MTKLDYELHKLGWRAFQDLCAIVCQTVLGQTFHTFADSNDAGRDGAFHGKWEHNGSGGTSLLDGVATVAQCKFSAGSGTLSPSMMADEMAKVQSLHKRGVCDAYIVMTNLRISGSSNEALIKQIKSYGVKDALLLDGNWICQQISKNADLRRYVPRVYGLGDLGKILDDRRLRQAQALISRLKNDLTTFVPTAAYRRASDAISHHRFVLILGEPACGKSTIAAMLAISALDQGGRSVRRVDSADELVSSWDPDDADQLFWIDDAFGSIRHDSTLTDGWTRRMDQVMTAVENGAQIILTSRDYIYRDARAYLKEYAYPRLREDQVVIDISELTKPEKEQILYNHLKSGDQSYDTLESWRPNLHKVAAVDRFQPEVARRLSLKAFTRNVPLLTWDRQLIAYFERPVTFLADVLEQLPPSARAAMACVYISGDELAAPVTFTPNLLDTASRLGSTTAETLAAFQSLDGTFLQLSRNTQLQDVWRFRHPTIREGFATIVAKNPNAVRIFIDGLSDSELVQQIDCGGATRQGTLVHVPPSLYIDLIPRINLSNSGDSSWSNPVPRFLTKNCSPEFLREWSKYHKSTLKNLCDFGSYVSSRWEPGLLACLHDSDALPEDVRRSAVETLSQRALEFDGGWMSSSVSSLFEPDEWEALKAEIEVSILPYIHSHIDDSGEGWDVSMEPDDRFREANATVDAYKVVFANDSGIADDLEAASDYIYDQIQSANDSYTPDDDFSASEAPHIPESNSDRDVFEDIAEGH